MLDHRGDAVDEVEFAISLPVDSEGFLRRACPNCSLEFKWLARREDGDTSSTEDYFCPYCGASAAPSDWFTSEQLRFIEEEAVDRVIGPSLEELGESIRQLGRSSGGLFGIHGKIESPERKQAAPVFEPDDMRRIDFTCHPEEPLKVDEAWAKRVYCLRCGQLRDVTSD